MRSDFQSKKQPTGNYEVGYKKPPTSGQWQKGQSGNPKGRRKNELIGDRLEAYHQVGQEIVTIRVGGKLRRMTLMQAEAYKAQIDAAAGDARARRDMMRAEELYAQRHPFEEETVIECKLVFPEEEDRLVQLAQENNELHERIKQLEGKLGATLASHLLSGPSCSGESSNSP